VLPVVRQPQAVQEQHWTGVKLHGWLRQQLQIQLGYSTLLRYLHEQDFRLKVPRPWPEGQDELRRQKFVEELQALAADPQVELWFGDETGVEGDPRPRRRWAHKSDRIKTPYYEGCQVRGVRRRDFFLKAVFVFCLFFLSRRFGVSKRYPGLRVSGVQPVLLLLSVHASCSEAAHHDVCGPGQETSAPNLPNGSWPTQGRSGRAPFQIVRLPAWGFRRAFRYLVMPRPSPSPSRTVRPVGFSSATGPRPFVVQSPQSPS